MIVKIGEYPKWWGPYQIIGLLQYLGFSEDRCDAWATKVPEKVVDFIQWFHDKFRQRKVKIKIHKYDTWNLDATLAMIAHPMLVQLKEQKHGIPNMDCMQYGLDSQWPQATFDFYKNDDTSFAVAEAEWNEIMDKMIFSMYEIANGMPGQDAFHLETGEFDFEKYPEDEGKIAVPVRWKKEPVIDMEGMKEYSKRIQEGCELFGKYYQNLWD